MFLKGYPIYRIERIFRGKLKAKDIINKQVQKLHKIKDDLYINSVEHKVFYPVVEN
jgi:hypothetical protein